MDSPLKVLLRQKVFFSDDSRSQGILKPSFSGHVLYDHLTYLSCFFFLFPILTLACIFSESEIGSNPNVHGQIIEFIVVDMHKKYY